MHSASEMNARMVIAISVKLYHKKIYHLAHFIYLAYYLTIHPTYILFFYQFNILSLLLLFFYSIQERIE